jgi:hypothetical protein
VNEDRYTFLDTDLHIHRLSIDPPVRKAATAIFENNRPTAISAFSLVELKGNYIQDLILLRRKISDSDSFEIAAARILSTGGRRCFRMLAQFIASIGGVAYQINPWLEGQRQLLVYLDGQIAASWEEFRESIDRVFDDFRCTRATEPPTDDTGTWTATVPHCTTSNVRCTIVDFMKQHSADLERLVHVLTSLDPTIMTEELRRIAKVAKQTITKSFPWEGTTCRSVGDLLIALQSKSGKSLVSSNYKEHRQMSVPLGYEFQEFPISNIRSK